MTHFPLADAVLDCDGLINLPKMKTHQLTRITGAVKNLFGCIPGKRKALYHVQFPDVDVFSRLLVQLNLTVRPRLHVMDGIIAMEGNGPVGGTPVDMRVAMASLDPLAMDTLATKIMGFDPGQIMYLAAMAEAGMGQGDIGKMQVLGTPPDECRYQFKPHRKLIEAYGFEA